MRPVYVVGHRNPDLDSIAAAVAYAWKLRPEINRDVLPARTGAIDDQTLWVLDRLGIEVPVQLTDAAPMFGWVMRCVPAVLSEASLRDAWEVLKQTRSVCPVVDVDRKPVGLVTLASLFDILSKDGDPTSMDLSDLLARPVAVAQVTNVPCFKSQGRIRDRIGRALKNEHDEFWVVDAKGRYEGIAHKADMLHPERLKLVLVDHSGDGQSVGSLDEAEILEVIDHHSQGTLPSKPVRTTIEPVAATSTIVWEKIAGTGRELPPGIASLLLCGILAETNNLSTTVTRPADRFAAEVLSKAAFAPGSPLVGETPDAFVKALLRAGDGLEARSLTDLIRVDLRIYDANNGRFGVSQVEVVDAPDLGTHVTRLRNALATICEERELKFGVLMVTEMVTGSSRIVMHLAPQCLDALPWRKLEDGTLDAPGVVSRKRQLMPAIMALLAR